MTRSRPPCSEPHPLETEALAAFTEQRKAHDATTMTPCLPCYPRGRMNYAQHRSQYRQCLRAAKEVLAHLKCRGLTVVDAMGWHMLNLTPRPKPMRKRKKRKTAPKPKRKLRLVHSRPLAYVRRKT